ncbi:MAG: hypothetical protein AAGA29_12025 [Planctomycetota bacterium]
MIEFQCSGCGRAYRVEDAHAGKATTCKQCGQALAVPTPGASPGAASGLGDGVGSLQAAPAAAAAHGPAQGVVVQEPAKAGGAVLGMGVTSLVLGIIALLASWIPFIGCISLPFAGLGLVFALVGGIMAITSGGRGLGFPIAGAVACVLSIGVMVTVSYVTAAALQHASDEFAEIIDEAVYEEALERVEYLRASVEEMEAQLAGFEAAAPMLAKLEIGESSVAWGEWAGRARPVVTIEVTNTLDQPVYGGDFTGRLTSPGEAEPWVEAEVSFYEWDGLGPGETATWVARPEPKGPWGATPSDRTDLVLTLTPLRLKDADGNSLFVGPLYSGQSQSLGDYREEIAELEAVIRAFEAGQTE